MSKNIVLKEAGKLGGKPTYNLYIKDATFVYASVIKPKENYNKDGMEYSTQVFISQEDADALDALLINKELFRVNKDKNKKKKIKYPLVNDKGEPTAYSDLDGLVGLTITKGTANKDGKAKAPVTVLDSAGEAVTANVGNGSKGVVKCWCYRNDDDLLVMQLDTIVVSELVEYEGGEGGTVVDDELGITYTRKQAGEVVETPPAKDDHPFDDDEFAPE